MAIACNNKSVVSFLDCHDSTMKKHSLGETGMIKDKQVAKSGRVDPI